MYFCARTNNHFQEETNENCDHFRVSGFNNLLGTTPSRLQAIGA
jgi:hypothetical protein